jgi:hypothetical protein
MSINTTILIGTIWSCGDIKDIFEKKIKELGNFKLKDDSIKWSIDHPSYSYAEIEYAGSSILFHFHSNGTFFGINCHSLSVQNLSDNIEVLVLFRSIVEITGGLLEREEGKGFKSFSESYSENEGFESKKKFLGIPLKYKK